MAPPAPTATTVTFRYVSPVPPGASPADPEGVTGCAHHWAPVAGAGPTIRGSWSETFHRPTSTSGEETRIVVPDVPVGPEHAVQVWDLGLCNVDPSREPVSFHTLFANGVALTRVVQHPSGLEGVAFTVAPDGTVAP